MPSNPYTTANRRADFGENPSLSRQAPRTPANPGADQDNPYRPPKARLKDTGPTPLPWTVWLPLLVLLLWGSLSFAGIAIDLAVQSRQSAEPLWYFYWALGPSLLMLLSAYTLWRRNAWVLALLPLAVILRVLPYFVLLPPVGRSVATTLAGRLLERLPLGDTIEAALLLAMAIYGLFLHKWSVIRGWPPVGSALKRS